jgi:hypothetical protein
MEENKKVIILSNTILIQEKDKNEKLEETKNNIVLINYLQKDKRTVVEPHRIKRIITSTDKWIFNKNDLTYEKQLDIIKQIYYKLNEPKSVNLLDESLNINTIDNNCNFVIQQLKNKLYSYKSQDNEKKKYNTDCFVNMKYVIELLIQSNLKCYYCKNNVKILYEIVREQEQWTLDRLDNDIGHNINNVVISCLKCNIRKKIIHPERYVNTKKCINVVKIDWGEQKI